jgi:hypothetical protein
MSTAERKKQEKQGLSPDAAVMERLTQLERKIDALCRYLLPPTGQYAAPEITRCRPIRRYRR